MFERFFVNRFVGGLILLASILGIQLKAHAQDMSMMGGGFSGPSFSLEHQSEMVPDSHPGLHIEEQKAFAGFPVLKSSRDGRESVFGVFVRGQRTLLGRPLTFSDRQAILPEEFGTAEIGFSWNQKHESGNREGVALTYGSAGRRILDNGLTPIVTATFSMERMQDDGNSWVFLLNYSNNRAVLNHIPLPGIAYSYNGKSYKFLLGAPFIFGMWRPDPWFLTVIASPFTISTEAAYRFWGPLMLFSGVGWQPKAYQNLVSGSDDRLIFDKKEWTTGIRAFLGPKINFSVAYVHNFDRRFLLGRSVSNPSSAPINIDDSGGIQLKARVAF